MKEVSELIEKAGLSKGETKVYLALLELGISSIGPIVTKSEVSASKVYKILDRLLKKGLVSSIIKAKVKEFKIENPNNLIEYLEDKEKEINLIKEELNKNMSSLLEKVKLAENKSNCTVYEGFKGLKSVFEQSLNELKKGDLMYISGITESTEEIRNYFIHYYKNQAKIGFKIKAIFDETAKYKAEERKNKLTEFKFMPKGIITPATFIVYKNKTIIEVGNPHYILTILILNKEISESFIQQFNLLWKLAKH
jgi:HTH-type transcriptional regulator, sugar sensing transcriptional regulator